MNLCITVKNYLLDYRIDKTLTISDKYVWVPNRIIQLIILCLFLWYGFNYRSEHQHLGAIQSGLVTKVKGVLYTNFSNHEFNKEIENPEEYRRVWDVADYVFPAKEKGAVFITTNIFISSKQKQGICGEDPTVPGAVCNPENHNCISGKSLSGGNGVMTGECIYNNQSHKHVCEIHSWCPVRTEVNPLKNNRALLAESKKFKLLIKNFVQFPKMEKGIWSNLKFTNDRTYMEKCHYDPLNAPDCPVFVLGDIVRYAGQDYDEMAVKGGIISIRIIWDCGLNFYSKICFPTYKFNRLDNPDSKLAPGWNIRHADHYSDSYRTYYNMHGIKFIIIVEGRGKKFSWKTLFINGGAIVGIFSLELIIFDALLWLMCYRKNNGALKDQKYEKINPDVGNPTQVEDLETVQS